MLALGCFVLASVVLGVLGQNHGHGHTQLHGGICHSNHQQLTEDQVIHQIVTDIDTDNNDNITVAEMFFFFGELLGKTPPNIDLSSLSGISETLLIQLAAGFTATTQELIHAWHNKYHDDIGFITATVNNVVDSNKNGILDITDITAVKDIARNEYDANHDGTIQESEMIAFFENIYKSDACGN